MLLRLGETLQKMEKCESVLTMQKQLRAMMFCSSQKHLVKNNCFSAIFFFLLLGVSRNCSKSSKTHREMMANRRMVFTPLAHTLALKGALLNQGHKKSHRSKINDFKELRRDSIIGSFIWQRIKYNRKNVGAHLGSPRDHMYPHQTFIPSSHLDFLIHVFKPSIHLDLDFWVEYFHNVQIA